MKPSHKIKKLYSVTYLNKLYGGYIEELNECKMIEKSFESYCLLFLYLEGVIDTNVYIDKYIKLIMKIRCKKL